MSITPVVEREGLVVLAGVGLARAMVLHRADVLAARVPLRRWAAVDDQVVMVAVGDARRASSSWARTRPTCRPTASRVRACGAPTRLRACCRSRGSSSLGTRRSPCALRAACRAWMRCVVERSWGEGGGVLAARGGAPPAG